MNLIKKTIKENRTKHLVSISFGIFSLALIAGFIGVFSLIKTPESHVSGNNSQLVIPQESVKGVNEQIVMNASADMNPESDNTFDFQGTIFTTVKGILPAGWSVNQSVENNGLAERFTISKNDVDIVISVSQPFEVGNVSAIPCYVSFDEINPSLARVEFARTNENKRRFRYFSDYKSILFFDGDNKFDEIVKTQKSSFEYVACGTTNIPFVSSAPQTQKQINEGEDGIAWLYVDIYGNNVETIREADQLVSELKY